MKRGIEGQEDEGRKVIEGPEEGMKRVVWEGQRQSGDAG